MKNFAGINFRESTFSMVKKGIYFREFGPNSRNFLPAKISSRKVEMVYYEKGICASGNNLWEHKKNGECRVGKCLTDPKCTFAGHVRINITAGMQMCIKYTSDTCELEKKANSRFEIYKTFIKKG